MRAPSGMGACEITTVQSDGTAILWPSEDRSKRSDYGIGPFVSWPKGRINRTSCICHPSQGLAQRAGTGPMVSRAQTEVDEDSQWVRWWRAVSGK